MKIGIIGAGFTGLAAAYYLSKQGHSVTVFERDANPGGLAVGYQEKEWDWTLEKHYHHWFTNDDSVLSLAREIGHSVLIRRINTSIYIDNSFYPLDSPQKILTFPKLPLLDRLRMGVALGLLRFNPWWRPLEKIKAVDVLPKIMGKRAWDMIWWPQLSNKMGEYANKISLVWFWTRITKRTPSVTYPEGGFLRFADHIVSEIKKNGGEILFNTDVIELKDDKKAEITYKKLETRNSKLETFDAVVVTLPSFLFAKITPTLPASYTDSLARLKGLSATNMVLRLKKPFFPNNTYWLSICEKNSPIMALIEHTNFMDKKHYNNEHLLYIGNYAVTHDKLDWDKKKILAFYDKTLKRINPEYAKNLIGYEFFRAPFAQPIVPINYSKMIPAMVTPLPHVFLANIEQVYPWDRGTNYAVELGKIVAKKVIE